MPTTPATSTRIEEIDTLAREYASARKRLADRVESLQVEIQALHRRRREGIIDAAQLAKSALDELVAAVQAAPDLFVKPRTITLHGIKLGFEKGKGRMAWDIDDDKLVEKIKRIYAGDNVTLAVLINTTEEPSKDGLKTLDARELARLGVTIEGVEDVVIVKATDGEIDKLVKRILKEGQPAEEGGK